MRSSFYPRDVYKNFEDFERAWHKNYQHYNPNWKNSMYMDGQFDEIPYWLWDENKLIEFPWFEVKDAL